MAAPMLIGLLFLFFLSLSAAIASTVISSAPMLEPHDGCWFRGDSGSAQLFSGAPYASAHAGDGVPTADSVVKWRVLTQEFEVGHEGSGCLKQDERIHWALCS